MKDKEVCVMSDSIDPKLPTPESIDYQLTKKPEEKDNVDMKRFIERERDILPDEKNENILDITKEVCDSYCRLGLVIKLTKCV